MSIDIVYKNSFPIPGLFGLVVCGGKSSRMGVDKSMLDYFGKPQCYHVYETLSQYCEKVFISCNEQQADGIDHEYETLIDLNYYSDAGPMAGLLTALTSFSHNNFLVVGCDYPFLQKDDLADFLLLYRNENAAAFYNEEENIYEPVLAFYNHNVKRTLMDMFSIENYSLRDFLKTSNAAKYYPKDKKSIRSIDNLKDFTETKELLRSSQ